MPKNRSKGSKILYNSGDLFLREKYKKILKRLVVGNYNSFYINYWSFLHALSGILTYFILKFFTSKSTKLWLILLFGWIIHSLWESWQIFIGMTKLKNIWNIIDIVTDTLFFTFGMLLAALVQYLISNK